MVSKLFRFLNRYSVGTNLNIRSLPTNYDNNLLELINNKTITIKKLLYYIKKSKNDR